MEEDIKKIAVLYHDDADGFGAACAAWLNLRDSAEYFSVNYGQGIPPLPIDVDTIYVLDFCFKPEEIQLLIDSYGEKHILILDHHNLTPDQLVFDCVICDKSKSGAMLAWEFFHGEAIPAPVIIQYVQDRDLWKFELPDSKAVNAYIASLPYKFSAWRYFDLHSAIEGGNAILRFQQQQINKALEHVRFINLLDYKNIPIVNATDNISEIGNILCESFGSPFSITYCDRVNKRTYSLRSIGDFDVSAIAKQFMGGGHKNAAGFETELDYYHIIKGIYKEVRK